jgi:hypothetical protein
MQYFFGPSTDPCGTPNDRIFSVDTIFPMLTILEKVVANRLEEHLESNSLHDDLQSAYRACHSTETALRSNPGFFNNGRTTAFLNVPGTYDSVIDLLTIVVIIGSKVSMHS